MTGCPDSPGPAASSQDGCPSSWDRTKISRRSVLAGLGALAAAPIIGAGRPAWAIVGPSPSPAVVPAPPVVPAAAPGTPLPGFVKWQHAVGDPRGSDVVALYGRTTEARFGTMFKSLKPFTPDDLLLHDLAYAMTESRGPLDDIRPDGHDNLEMPSGFIYIGQFIDHDMTRDTTSLTDMRMDPHALLNFDTPQFDLGSVYGQGPLNNPELYEADGKHLLLRTNANGIEDLPRDASGSAFVGDPRNDENLIIAQLQMAFIKLHNHFLEADAAGSFSRAQQLTRWHFQWVIVHDFLPHLVGQPLLDSMIMTLPDRIRARTMFYRPGNPLRPMMPIEYSVGAYRWGHSGIRAEYEMHDFARVGTNPAVLPIFDTNSDPKTARDLRGGRPIYTDATIDWNYFFEIPGVQSPDDTNYARLIDTEVARPLLELPDSVVAHVSGAVLALAERNLLRGSRLGLPSGQDVAAQMRTVMPSMPAPMTNDQLDPGGRFQLSKAGWGGQAPLWFYCLQESAVRGAGRKLGPVAGRIVAEVILGLLQLDQASYWNAPRPFVPVGGPGFRMGDLLKLAKAPIFDPRTQQPIA